MKTYSKKYPKRILQISRLLIPGLCFLAFSCSDPSVVGSNLLSDENIDVNFTDTVALTSKTIPGDSVATYRSSISFNGRTYLLGTLDDTYFGQSESILYLGLSNISAIPQFAEDQIDSVVLALAYDTLGAYGNRSGQHMITVHQMNTRLNSALAEGEVDTLFSNQYFEFDPAPIGSESVTPDYLDSVTIFSPFEDTLVRLQPQMRIRMDLDFWETILLDTLKTESDSAFQESVKGLALVSVPLESSMIGFNLSSASGTTHSVLVYYTDEDSVKTTFTFDAGGSIRHNYFKHSYGGAFLEPYNTQGGTSIHIPATSTPTTIALLKSNMDSSSTSNIGM